MSLFKERTANAKQVIALQNELNALKLKLKEAQSAPQCDNDLSELEEKLAEALATQKQLKADLKKVKSENTRLKNKLATLED